MFIVPSPTPILPSCSVNGSARPRFRREACSVASGSKNKGAVAPVIRERRRCQCFDFYNELVPYKDAWSLQKSLVERRHILMHTDEDCSDMLVVLQHCPVYTLGTNGSEEYLNFKIKDAPFDVIRTERGGEVTYHGPGQIVMYPILNLRYHKMDLHWYLRCLEEVVIRVLAFSFSIKASRLKGLTGVWVGDEKVAAIGIHVTKWITFHGLAVNVNPNLSHFRHIVPCGIKDRHVGSIKEILGRSHCQQIRADLLRVAHQSLLKEFSEVFQLSLTNSSLPSGISLKEQLI